MRARYGSNLSTCELLLYSDMFFDTLYSQVYYCLKYVNNIRFNALLKR